MQSGLACYDCKTPRAFSGAAPGFFIDDATVDVLTTDPVARVDHDALLHTGGDLSALEREASERAALDAHRDTIPWLLLLAGVGYAWKKGWFAS